MKKVIFSSILTAAFLAALAGSVRAEACNGGQCVGNGTQALNCPSSGGPTCADGETCICHCVKNGNSYTPTNECGVLKTKTVIEIIGEVDADVD